MSLPSLGYLFTKFSPRLTPQPVLDFFAEQYCSKDKRASIAASGIEDERAQPLEDGNR